MPLGRGLRKVSTRGEKKTAEDIGGRTQPASGAGTFDKADVRSNILLVERKDTYQLGYRLRHEDLRKLRKQAAQAGRYPVFQITFQPTDESYAVISWALFLDLFVREESDAG